MRKAKEIRGNRYNFNFYCRESKQSKKGLSPIELTINVSGERITVSLPLKCNPDEFKNKINSDEPNDILDYTSEIRTKLNKYITELMSAGISVNAKTIKEYFINGCIPTYTLNKLMSDFSKSLINKDSMRSYELAFDKISLYIDKEFEVDSITSAHLEDIKTELLKTFEYTTVKKTFSKLKTIFDYALDNGKIRYNPFNQIKFEKKIKQVEETEKLTIPELEIIRQQILVERLDKVRDLFLFQCNTGLSYCDIANLESNDFQFEDGMCFIKKTRQSTNVIFNVLLNNEALSIVEKYNYQLPKLSNQKYNSYLKEIGNICNINTKLRSNIACEIYTIKTKNEIRQYKLSLLECDDLIHMSSHQLIEIIANKKLPVEFKSLAYTHPDSESRVGAIRDLINLFNDDNKTDDEIENEASEQAQNRENELSSNSEMNDEFNFILGDSEGVSEGETEPSLPSMVIGNAHAFDDLVNMKPSDEAAKFLVLEETHRMWNGVLRANEEGKLDEVIERIKTEDGGEFWKYIQATFLNEFNEVIGIEKGDDYKFPYDPSLMQKLMVHYLTNNKSFGNWCGTGAGKTNAFLFATRKTNSRVTVAIVPNDVIDTLVKSINKIYPDSVVVVPQSSDELFTCDRSKFTYIIYNYEKFQGNNGAEDTVNKLLETNTIDFICLDEVQNVKVRDIETASSRSQFINSLVSRGRTVNPEMRTLAMSATPCINNLTEVRSIIELLTGVEHNEIGNRNTIANIHNAYKALLLNGFRYVPKYPIVIEERTVEVDCSEDAELYLDLINKEKGDISGIEYALAEKKLNSVKDELKPGTIVYATWVDGMAELLTKNIRKWGYSVESYNGESGNKDGRKEILDRFLSGKTDVLVCSKPISTGVDGLQYKCNKMVIVSLPWTDADYTQLKGRIYRQGSVFNRVEFVIPQIVINTPSGVVWSWDKMRKHAIDTKKSLGSAVVDGYIQKTYTINREKLLSKAMEALKDGLIDIETERTPIATEITYIMKEREYSESFINNVHSLANRSSSKTTHIRYVNNPDEFKEYHRQREISKESWVEDPVDRVADIINSWSNRYTRIIDMGCGMNKLKTVVNGNKTVQGVDHMNISPDVTVIEADMSNLNGIVDDNSKDVAVFCLSLWGVNYKDYFTEAYRILDNDGRMVIVEPSSKFGIDKHFSTIDEFVDDIENYGFERTGKVETHNNFVYLKFTKI